MNIYCDNSYYNPKYRYHLNSITKALRNDHTPEARDKVYGAWVRQFQLAATPEEADVVMLADK